MKQDIHFFRVNFSQINLTKEEVMRDMFPKKQIKSEDFLPLIHDQLVLAENYVDLQCGFRILADNSISIDKGNIYGDSFIFGCGKIIAKQINQATSLAIFAATVGEKFDRITKKYFQDSNPLTGFILDTIGSLAVEKTIDWMEGQLEMTISKNGMKMTNRFSPGYCGWDVSEQQVLFSLLPANFCGIRLKESSLMIPIKSVSGIIGIGNMVKRKAYFCSLCDMEQCYRRRSLAEKVNNER
ncbi:MAG: vitamin B12 dependent-methionine synthase activation domain-containing protein [Calditrichota bacterium]|jgi:hypothetical protein